jgi:hypothetical protein
MNEAIRARGIANHDDSVMRGNPRVDVATIMANLALDIPTSFTFDIQDRSLNHRLFQRRQRLQRQQR